MTTQPQQPTPNAQLAKMIDLLQVQVDDSPQMHTEVLNELHVIALTLNDILKEIQTFKAAQQAAPPAQPAAAPQPAQAAPANVRDFVAETLVMTTDDKGMPAFKVKGFPYAEFGVRVWPEVLPALGIDPANLRPGPNPLPAGLIVRAVMTSEGKPRKIIGKGDGSAISAATSTNGNGSHPAEPPEPPAFDDPPF